MKQEIWLGDCLELMKDIPGGSVDMVLCDPPYKKTGCKWDSIIPFNPMWAELKRITKNNGAFVFFCAQPFTSQLILSNQKNFKYSWVWKKNTTSNFTQAKNMPLIEHEDIVIFSEAKVGNGAKIKMNYFPQKIKGKARKWKNNQSSPSNPKAKNLIGRDSIDVVSDSFYPKTILEFPKDNSHLHPTQKPLLLCEYLIKTYTNESDIVLDFCAGSGTTGLAAKNLNRQFILIKKEKEYYDICVERLK